MRADFNLKREMKNELAFGRITGQNFYVHFHSHIEIYTVRRGELEVLVNGRQRVLREGEIAVAFSYDSHGYRAISESETNYLIIPRSYISDILHIIDCRRDDSPFISDPKVFKTVSEMMDRLIDEKNNEISKRGYVYSVLGAILDNVHSTDSDGAQVEVFSPEILKYISENFREELTLNMLAKKFGYNPSYLSHNFRENFGLSFIKYLTMLRLREAVLLMSNGKNGITECAIESGFGSMRSFYRAFREEFGMTPGEYFAKMQKSVN